MRTSTFSPWIALLLPVLAGRTAAQGPVISPATTILATPHAVSELDVAYDVATGRWLLAWVEGDGSVWVHRLRYDGLPLGPRIPIAGPDHTRHVSVASVRATGRFAVAYARSGAFEAPGEAYVRSVDPIDGSLSAPTVVAQAACVLDIDLGGDPSPGRPAALAAIVVTDDPCHSAPYDWRLLSVRTEVPSTGPPLAGATQQLARFDPTLAAMSGEVAPAVSPSNGVAGRWLVAWQERRGGQIDVFARAVDAQGLVVSETAAVLDDPMGQERRPTVATVNGDCFVVGAGLHDPQLGSIRELVARHVRAPAPGAPAPPFALTYPPLAFSGPPTVAVTAPAGRFLAGPFLEFDGEALLATWLEHDGTLLAPMTKTGVALDLSSLSPLGATPSPIHLSTALYGAEGAAFARRSAGDAGPSQGRTLVVGAILASSVQGGGELWTALLAPSPVGLPGGDPFAGDCPPQVVE